MRPLGRERAKGIIKAARGFITIVRETPNPYTYNTTEYSLWATSHKYLDVTAVGILNIFALRGLIK